MLEMILSLQEDKSKIEGYYSSRISNSTYGNHTIYYVVDVILHPDKTTALEYINLL